MTRLIYLWVNDEYRGKLGFSVSGLISEAGDQQPAISIRYLPFLPLILSLSCIQPSLIRPIPKMPPSPTPNAPKNYEELEKLLADDTKVKVAGTYYTEDEDH